MTTTAPHYEHGYTTEATLFVAFELSEKTHIPPDFVVDLWATDGESGSHHDFRF
jgi:hypothetical protein